MTRNSQNCKPQSHLRDPELYYILGIGGVDREKTRKLFVSFVDRTCMNALDCNQQLVTVWYDFS